MGPCSGWQKQPKVEFGASKMTPERTKIEPATSPNAQQTTQEQQENISSAEEVLMIVAIP